MDAKPAATVILLRSGSRHEQAGLEVLMLRRGAGARFMPGSWVFAGGGVDPADRERAGEIAGEAPELDADELSHRIAAARELGEEAGVEIDPLTLRPYSRWITPTPVPIRFDTRFYVAPAPAHCRPEPDGREMDEARWIAPWLALDEHAEGRFEITFPTIKHLEGLSEFATVDELYEHAATLRPEPILPRVAGTEDDFSVLLPGEPGYEDGV